MIGPRPIETVGNSQKSGISQGCGYDDSPPPGCSSRRKFSRCSLGEPAFEERAGVDAGRGVALEVDDVAVVAVVLAAEEMVEADFVERRREANVEMWPPMPSSTLVGAHDHRHRVPADEALDAALDLAAAGIAASARPAGMVLMYGVLAVNGSLTPLRRAWMRELAKQALDAAAVRPAGAHNRAIEPLARFEGFELGSCPRGAVFLIRE